MNSQPVPSQRAPFQQDGVQPITRRPEFRLWLARGLLDHAVPSADASMVAHLGHAVGKASRARPHLPPLEAFGESRAHALILAIAQIEAADAEVARSQR